MVVQAIDTISDLFTKWLLHSSTLPSPAELCFWSAEPTVLATEGSFASRLLPAGTAGCLAPTFSGSGFLTMFEECVFPRTTRCSNIRLWNFSFVSNGPPSLIVSLSYWWLCANSFLEGIRNFGLLPRGIGVACSPVFKGSCIYLRLALASMKF